MEVYAPRFVRMPIRLACVDMTKSLPLAPVMKSHDLEPNAVTVTLYYMKLYSLDHSVRRLP